MSVCAYRTGVIAVIVIAAALVVSSALQDSQTHDEVVHLTAGYSYWKTGDFRLSPEHPPFGKLVMSLPLLWLQPDFDPAFEDWQKADPWPIGKAFLYSNRIPADTILMAGRIPVIVMYLALALSLAWWVGRSAGPSAALAALIMLALEPTVMAHSRYVTTDIPVTLFIFLAWVGWCLYLERGTNLLLIVTALLTGLAFATKFSALFLPFAFLLTRQNGSKASWRKISILIGIALLVALSTYGFSAQSVESDPTLYTRMHNRAPSDNLESSVIQIRIPGYYFLRGIHMLIRDELGGYPAYFLGEYRSRGTWLYFPTAFLLKSSLAWLALLLLGGTLAVIGKFRTNLRLFVVPAVILFALTLVSSFNIGIRHLLPVYPFVCAFAATVLFDGGQKAWIKAVGSVLLGLFIVESGAAYPHYLSYFNAAVGGPENGYRYLADSNLDWGQDLKRLGRYLEANKIDRTCLSYFGTADPTFYGVHSRELPALKRVQDLEQLNCVVAISIQHLFALDGVPFEALQRLRPTDRVGKSILIYDLRQESLEARQGPDVDHQELNPGFSPARQP